ncbi:hypothetical protein [Enterovibrio calviensis]|uniref:hypothetical protein n=1 Tax=Enterovibrio calviensis TaxID=91359 RepID=UPI00054DF202|nr:hypothetical protein [Enterovibrio calviensis]
MSTLLRIKPTLYIVGLLGALITLSACTSTRHDQLADLGFATPYLEGYDDGCHSKVTAAKTIGEGFRQDPERMFKEARYANGWNDGYEQCYVSKKSFY